MTPWWWLAVPTFVRQVLAKAEVRLAEPVMICEVSTEYEMVGRVVQDMVGTG